MTWRLSGSAAGAMKVDSGSLVIRDCQGIRTLFGSALTVWLL